MQFQHSLVSCTHHEVHAQLSWGRLLQPGQSQDDITERIVINRPALPHPDVQRAVAEWITQKVAMWCAEAGQPCEPERILRRSSHVASIEAALQLAIDLPMSDRNAHMRYIIVLDWYRLVFGEETIGALLIVRNRSLDDMETPHVAGLRAALTALQLAIRHPLESEAK